MHCNLKQPVATQSVSAFISSHMPSFKSLSLSVSAMYCWYVTLRSELELWPRDVDLWSWTCIVDRLRHGQTVYEIWAKSNNPWRSYCSLNIWPYDLEHVSRIALCSEIVYTKFQLSQAIRSWNVTIFMLIRHDTLWPWPLARWPWKFVIDLVSRGHSL